MVDKPPSLTTSFSFSLFSETPMNIKILTSNKSSMLFFCSHVFCRFNLQASGTEPMSVEEKIFLCYAAEVSAMNGFVNLNSFKF